MIRPRSAGSFDRPIRRISVLTCTLTAYGAAAAISAYGSGPWKLPVSRFTPKLGPSTSRTSRRSCSAVAVTPPPWFSSASITPRSAAYGSSDSIRATTRFSSSSSGVPWRHSPLSSRSVGASSSAARSIQVCTCSSSLSASGPGGRQKSFITAVPETSSPSKKACRFRRCRSSVVTCSGK